MRRHGAPGVLMNANVPEPPIALFTPVELFSVLIGSVMVISDIINISSWLILVLFSVDVTAIDVLTRVVFDVIGLIVDMSDVVAFIDELIEDDVVSSDVVTFFAITLFAVALFIDAGFILEVVFAFTQ